MNAYSIPGIIVSTLHIFNLLRLHLKSCNHEVTQGRVLTIYFYFFIIYGEQSGEIQICSDGPVSGRKALELIFVRREIVQWGNPEEFGVLQ